MFWKRIFGRSGGGRAASFRAAPGQRLYAIGDVHGRADLLGSLFKAIDADASRHPDRQCITVLLGDYVDRGPASRQVIDLLIARSRARRTVCLAGNHELMLLGFLAEPETWEAWAQCGGMQTLLSYGIRSAMRLTPEQAQALSTDFARALPPEHRDFLAALPLTFESGDVLFVHAGLKPGTPLDQQKAEDLAWIREEFLSFKGDFGRFVVHGHTPVEAPDRYPNRINIDTGAYATGRLTCLIVEDDQLTLL